ncbi:NDP-sugar synthase [Streptomyces sp. NPDC088785]|uniref:nucleotidyltransferase family protein n=1 Tax=Streptomyces sp. NPDC088785 TaxID=3365897 RepID=UPI00381267A3
MKAFVLAGGKGVRLRPYTTRLPKPLVPIGGEYAMLEITLTQLARSGVDEVFLSIGHLGHVIRSCIGDGSRWNLRVTYIEEDSPLGTLGPLLPALDRLPEQFLFMNGDLLTDLDHRALFEGHVASGAELSLAAAAREVRVEFGVLEVDGDRVKDFVEKPVVRNEVSMGAYAVSASALRDYTPGQQLGVDRLILDLLAAGRTVRAHHHRGLWIDVGRPEDYDRANSEFDLMRAELLGEAAHS